MPGEFELGTEADRKAIFACLDEVRIVLLHSTHEQSRIDAMRHADSLLDLYINLGFLAAQGEAA